MKYQTYDSATAYYDDLWNYLVAVEQMKWPAYDAHDGVVTIGIGFNLTGASQRPLANLVLKKFGLNLSASASSSDPAERAEAKFVHDLRVDIAEGSTGIADLNRIMAARANLAKNDPNFAAYIGTSTPRSQFAFLSNDEVRAVFDVGVQQYITRLDNKLGVVLPMCKEKIALISMMYNGGGLFTDDLIHALKPGKENRAEAWFAIRYMANYVGRHACQGQQLGSREQSYYDQGIDKGWAKRRNDEAAVFGLYDDPSNTPTLSESLDVYRMFTLHHDYIAAYESYYGTPFDGGVPYRADCTGYRAATTIRAALNPACQAIVDDLRANANTDIANAYGRWAQTQTTFDPLNLFVDPMRGDALAPQTHDHYAILDASKAIGNDSTSGSSTILIGDGNSTTRGGGDLLRAGSGIDLLVGGAGNDTLVSGTSVSGTVQWSIMAGGEGNDCYDIKAGSHAVVEDKHGFNRIVYDGKPLGYFYSYDGGQTYLTDAAGFNAKMAGGDFVVYDTVHGGQVVLNKDFQSGDFGINLITGGNTSFPAIPMVGAGDHNILGDYNPLLDKNGNIQYDSLGNIMGDLSSPHPDQNDTLYGSATGNDYINAGGGYNEITAGDGSNTIVGGSTDGSAGGNTISAGNGNNSIHTRDNNATVHVGNGSNGIVGGTGQDDFFAGNGNNTLIGGGGQDILIAGNGTNQIYANQEVDLATALARRDAPGGVASGQKGDLIAVGTGNNTIVGSNGNDLIFTAGGHNTIVMGNGANSFWGGVTTTDAWTGWYLEGPRGHQWVVGANSFSTPMGNTPVPYNGSTFAGVPVGVSNDTIYGGNGNSEYALGNGNNWLDAGNGNDIIGAGTGSSTIFAGSGNSTIFGSGGSHFITLGSGNDWVELQGGSSNVAAGSGNDTIFSGDASANWADSEAKANNYISGGSGASVLYGSGGDDTLISGSEAGTGAATAIYGGNGNEYMVGGGGDDSIFGGSGNDTISTGEGTTMVQAGTGATTINGGSGDMVVTLSAAGGEKSFVYGGDGNNSIFGGAGTDTIYTGDGNTLVDLGALQFGGDATVYGGVGVDTINGGSGNYVINAGDGGTADNATIVYAGSGITEVDGGAGYDQILGGSGIDTLVAGSGDTTIRGGSGTQFMYAGDGNSTLIAGNGYDVLNGGSGADVLQGADGIAQFIAGTGNETIIGGTGVNSYEFDSGFGNIELQNASVLDTFKFGDGVSASNFVLSTTIGSDGNTDVVITDTVGGGCIVLNGGTDGGNVTFSFADGTTMTRDDLMAQYGASSTVAGANGNLVFSPTANDTLSAGAGNDTLFGWNGGDTMVGGTGNDTFVINHTNDVVQAFSSGTNVNTIQASVSYTASANVQNITATGKAAVELTGNDMNNIITANSADDTLVAGSGIATLVGGAGNDTFVVNNSADVVQAQFQTNFSGWSATSNTNTILASSSYTTPANVQVLTGTGSADIALTDSNYNVKITANAGSDTLTGGAGDDTLFGGAGRDTFVMGNGTGSDTVVDSSAQGGVIQLQDGLSLSDVLVGKVGDDLVVQSTTNPNDAMTIKGYYTNPQSSWTIQDATGAQMAAPSGTPTPDVTQALAALTAERSYIAQATQRLAGSFVYNWDSVPYPVLQPDGTYSLTRAAAPSGPIMGEGVTTTSSGMTATYVPPAGTDTTYPNLIPYYYGYWYAPPQITPTLEGQYPGAGTIAPGGTMGGSGTITDYSNARSPITYSQSGPAQPFYTQTASGPVGPSNTSGIAKITDTINVYSTTADSAVVYADSQGTYTSNPLTMWQQLDWVPVSSSLVTAAQPSYSVTENISQPMPYRFSVDSLTMTQTYSTITQYTQYQGNLVGPLLSDPGTLSTTSVNGQPAQAFAVAAGQTNTAYNIQTINVNGGGHTIYDETADTSYALRNGMVGPFYGSRAGDRTIINAWSGDNTINGGVVVYTGTGNDSVDNAVTVYGGSGNDTVTNSYEVRSGTGNDSVSDANIVYGGSGNDTITNSYEVHSGSGNDLITGPGGMYLWEYKAYGGSGNDTISGVGEVFGGTGNDLLVNDGMVFAGSGNETVLGAQYVNVDPNAVGDELVGATTGDEGYAVLNAFYRSQGISDWYARYTNPSSPASIQFAQTLQTFENQLAQMQANTSSGFFIFGATNNTSSSTSGSTTTPTTAADYNQFLASVQSAITSANLPLSANEQDILNLTPLDPSGPIFGLYYAESTLSTYLKGSITDLSANAPLPVLATVEGSAVQPSSAYAGMNTPVTPVSANNFAELGSLLTSGYLNPSETINVGWGVKPSDLRLSWGHVQTTLTGSATDKPSSYVTLNVGWGGDAKHLQVIIPHSKDPVAAGLIEFGFSDGTRMTVAQLIAMAPPAPPFDPVFVFDPAMGNQTLPLGMNALQFAAGIDPSQISVIQDASGNFVVSYNNGAATLTIPAADAISSPVVATYANGTSWQFVNANGGTYTYNAGSGVVYLINAMGSGTVQFGTGITSSMITLGIGSLMLRVGNGGDVLHIEGFNPQDALNSGEIQNFKFADGTTLSYAQLLSRGFDIYGTTGNETLTGTNLDNRFYAGTGNDVMIGSGAHDTMYGGVGNETMIGGTGDELMIAGSGLTTMMGGTGTNTFVINNTADVVQAQAGAVNTIETSVSYTASANVQTLTGTGTADIVLTGNDVANTITANSGNDTLIAGSGVATMVGGTGNDTFVVNNVNDVVQAQSTGSNVNTIETSVDYTASANVQNLTGIGSADITLTGNDLANTITANSGNDTLVAGSGVATMVGGTGNDTFVVNNVNDVVEAQSTGSNVNTIETSVSYTASANVQNLVGIGSADITLTGNDLANTITANSGNDTLVAGTGVATMVGGTGSDTFYVNNTADVVQAESTGTNVNTVYTSVSYVAPANVENLIGTGSAAITLTGNDIADTLVANSGNDTLVAGTGVATMVGGTGNDTFYVNNVNDVVEAQSTGSNVNTVYTSVSYVAPANVENLIGIGSADITLTGNDLADTIVANSGNDTLIAGSGLATMVGGTGNDDFYVNNSADLINAQLTGSNVNTAYSSVDFSLATNGQNVQNLVGTGTANLTLTGNSLDNTITANSGNDTLVSLSGNDTLIAGFGVDTMVGGTGNDDFYVNNSADMINAQLTGTNLNTAYASVSYDMATNAQNVQNLNGVGTADLMLTGNSLDNVITANSGSDFINGGLGNDTLIGGTGVNVLEDTSGNNTLTDTQGQGVLVGGAGADTLTGGGGNSFFAAGAGNDVVAPGAFDSVVAFNAGDGADTIMTAAGGANTLSLGGAISFNNLSLARNGNDLIFYVTPKDSITFHDWYASTANADFTNLQIIGPQKASMLGGRLTGNANEFDFSQIVADFDKQTGNKPPLSPWNMTSALVHAHLSSSDTAAMGGDLAYYYGSQGSLAGMNLAAAQTTLKDPAFGTQAQTLSTVSSVQGATVTL